MSLLHKYPQFHLLSKLLEKESVHGAYPIYFREESEADNRYALGVAIHRRNGHIKLLGKLAAFFGCPDEDLPDPEMSSFEASDDWHGAGEGNLRTLADEMGDDLGEGFFDTYYTVDQIHTLGAQVQNATASPATLWAAMISEGQCRKSADTFVADTYAEMITLVADWCRDAWDNSDQGGPPPEDDFETVDLYFAESSLVLVWGEVIK